jgi:uncharacterized protein (DUF58 family)
VAEEKRRKFLEPEVLARLMPQPLLTRLAMEGSVSGQHKSPHRGSSVEFAEYRNYVPGDDIRRLDWRVFARSDRFYLKEFEAETNLRCYLIIDCSASMGFTGAGQSKLDYARRLASSLGYLVINHGDAAGVVCVGEKAHVDVPPRRNPAHLQLVLDTIEAAEPKGETGLIPVLHALAERIRTRAMVLVFSDLFCDPEELLSAFQHLRYKKHDLAVFHLLDRMEVDFKFDRPVRFQDMESSFSLVTEPATVRDEYQKQLNIFLNRMRDGCHEFKSEYRQVMTDQDYGKVLADFLVERGRMVASGR